jgi:hypothetical protein
VGPTGLESAILGNGTSVDSGEVSVPAIQPNPLGCKGQTDRPHKSGTYASVHGRTDCDYNAPALFVTTNLFRDRWYGWQFLKGDSESRYGWWRTNDATPHWNCLGARDLHLHRLLFPRSQHRRSELLRLNPALVSILLLRRSRACSPPRPVHGHALPPSSATAKGPSMTVHAHRERPDRVRQSVEALGA